MLVDPKPTNFIMTPENVVPALEYNAEYAGKGEDDKETYLLDLMDELEELKDLEDVRPLLAEKFKIRQLLKNSKLI